MEYEVIRSSRRTAALEIKNGKLVVRAPLRMSDGRIAAFVRENREWIEKHMARAEARQQELEHVEKLTPEELKNLAKQAAQVISERVRYYAPLIGVQYGRITIRRQRTKWGSCSGRGNLNFNCLLMLAPPEVLDSVVVHELCHIKQMNHSTAFYEEVLRVFPDYKKHQKWLKDNGDALMARIREES